MTTAASHTPLDSYAVYQHTLCYSIACSSVGIHCGQAVTAIFHPAPVDTGVVFRRVDLPGAPLIPARSDHRIPTPLCTKIGLPNNGPSVATIEHIMAALAAFEVDNVIIDINGPEAPIMDGSSAPFVTLLQCAGKVAQAELRRYIHILAPVTVTLGDKSCALHSANATTLSYKFLDHNSDPLLNQQHYTYVHNWPAFKQDLASARTIGFYDDIQKLQAKGLGLGGSLDNTVVLRQGEVLNPGGLRYHNEFARHKVLDALGDLYLAGYPILGAFTSMGGGHALNGALVEALLATPQAWALVTLPEYTAHHHGSTAVRIANQAQQHH